jgi:selenide,water dikinase
VGAGTLDDAGVFRLDEETALIQTVDFFTPIVDDPRTFGAISAANSLSDVYAMGGRPLTALAVVCVPGGFDLGVLGRILAGGQAKAREAGVPVVGGHTVKAPELKYGLSVTGVVHPDRVVTNAGARPGDVLYLTKPLGTGVITTSLKNEACPPGVLDGAVASMLRLNDAACEAMLEAGVHACTDVTGFGLAGHAHQMAHSSGVEIEFDLGALPILPGALEAAEGGHVPGGLKDNRKFLSEWMVGKAPQGPETTLLFDPQTSGGLLVCVPADRTERMVDALERRGLPVYAVGRVKEGRPGALSVTD